MPLLEIRNVSLGYDKVRVAENVNFSVNTGDYLCIVGENGSGKSTLMKTILGLLPVLTGSIQTDAALFKNEIGYLPQQTDLQRDFPSAVKEIVLSGFLNRSAWRPYYSGNEKKIAKEIMEKLAIEKLAEKSYRELSGGQQQRVLLARALCATRKILLLDEPAAGLDPDTAEEMYRLIRGLNQEDNITVIMITHDLASALKDASCILHIGEKPLFFASTKEYEEKFLMQKAAESSKTGGENNACDYAEACDVF